jgi:pilus assembly protein Flp/PilA
VKKLVSKLRNPLARRDEGASAVEYGLLVALIAVVIAATIIILGNALSDKFNTACDKVTSQTGKCTAPTP